jgi:glycosyltransferase involved in cell wall biosynthesis
LLPLFCDHPEFGTLLGEKARQRAMERYTLSQNITELEKLYAEVLQKQRVPVRGLA